MHYNIPICVLENMKIWQGTNVTVQTIKIVIPICATWIFNFQQEALRHYQMKISPHSMFSLSYSFSRSISDYLAWKIYLQVVYWTHESGLFTINCLSMTLLYWDNLQLLFISCQALIYSIDVVYSVISVTIKRAINW